MRRCVPLSERFFDHVRANDVVLRYGGDEFLLMFEEIPEKVFQQKLEDIRKEIAMADVPEYKEIRLSTSVGGVYGSCKVRDGVVEADMLLYQAKAAKKLCCLQADLTEMAEQPLEAELCNRRKRYFFGR